jgi:hypothetical protein
LGGTAAIAVAAFAFQSRHAALGRQVKRNVTRFLIDNGSEISNGVVSGGFVKTPMKTSTAVNATVASMLNNYAEQLGGPPPSPLLEDPSEDIPQPMAISQTQRPQHHKKVSTLSSPSSSPSPRGASRSGRVSMEAPAEINFKDDGGFSKAEKVSSEDLEYDANKLCPKGKRPPQDVDLFAD